MNNLITTSEFKTFRNISKKVNSDKIDECITLAQAVDLQDLLGGFFFDVIDNYESDNYADLMDGSKFTINGENYYQEGIKSLLADLAYSRYLYVINTNQTPFGLVQKVTGDSQPVDRNFIKDLVKISQQDANVKYRMIDKYLSNNKAIFPRYSKGNDTSINTFSQNFWVKS